MGRRVHTSRIIEEPVDVDVPHVRHRMISTVEIFRSKYSCNSWIELGMHVAGSDLVATVLEEIYCNGI